MVTLSVPAKWQRDGRGGETPRLIVVHCTVSPEQGTGAEAVANYFRTVSRPASTHLISDSNSTVRCVADEDTAYGAAGANRDGLHIELVGYPDQTRAQWLDAYSRAELAEAGPSIRAWSSKYEIPLRWLTVAQVRDGRTRGLCTHADVSQAFPDVSTGHWDPGPNFPKSDALQIWAPPTPVPPPPIEEPSTVMSYYHVVPTGRFYCVRPWTPAVAALTPAQAYELAAGGVKFVRVVELSTWTAIAAGAPK